MEEEWMSGARSPSFNVNGNRKSPIPDEDNTEILGIESVYNEESRDELPTSYSGKGKERDTSDKKEHQSSNADDNDANESEGEEAEDEVVMWKCAKCPLEFPDRESVVMHVRAVHKKQNPIQQPEEPEPDPTELSNDVAELEEEEDQIEAQYEFEYVNDADDYDDDMPTYSPPNPSSLPESPKSGSSGNRRSSRKSDLKNGNSSAAPTATTKRRGRPSKRSASNSLIDFSPMSNNISDDDYDVTPVRSSAKKPKPWATPSMSCDICFYQVSSSTALKKHMDANIFKPRIWKCTHCSEVFMDKEISDTHFATEHPADKDDIVTSWSCDSCDKTFDDEYKLAHHETGHGVKAPWGCRCCGRTFERASSLKQHENAEINKFYGGGYKCAGCAEVFLTGRELSSHQKLACTSPAILQCEKCDKTYNTFESLQKHRLTHTIELPWNCTKCYERFREKDELSVHLREAHGEDNSCTCNTCGKSFGRAAALRQHELICQKYLPPEEDENDEEREDPLDTNFEVQLYEPEEDTFKPSKKSKSKQQQRPTPMAPERKFKCDQCGTAFHSAAAVKIHAQIHNKQLFDCAYCSETFTRQKALEAHEMKRHEIVRKYACRQCHEKFVGPAELKQHILTKHISANGVFKCSLCSKMFSKMEYLKIHAKTHVAEKRFKCTQVDCEEIFYSPQERTKHLLDIHGLTEQVFKCKECGEEFEKQRELERHELTHTDEEETHEKDIDEGNFKCSTCDKRFLEEFLLTMHMKQHEQTEHRCEHCDKKFKNIASRNIHTKKVHGNIASTTTEEIVLD